MFNRTHLEHIIIALILQIIIGLLTGNWWAGAAFGSAIFIGREFAQAEYRYIKAHGGDRYKTPVSPIFGIFNKKYWNIDSILDFSLCTAAVIILALIIEYNIL